MEDQTVNFDWTADASDTPSPNELLSTGIDVLDRKLGGGIPPGRLIVLTASPASQSELFLYEMTRPRETLYLTTERTIGEVEETIRQNNGNLESTTIHRIDRADPLTDALNEIEGLAEPTTIIVDPFHLIEGSDSKEFGRFMNALKTTSTDMGGIAILHCLEGRAVSEQRDRTEYFADAIFDLRTTLRGGTVETILSVPKFRGGSARTEAIQLDLTTNVTIDVSRKIS